MPKHSRKQLMAVFERSRLYHDNYEKNMRAAVKDVVENKSSLKVAAQKYELSKSALHRKVQQYKMAPEDSRPDFQFSRQHGFKCIFTREEEGLLTKYLIEASEMCYGMTLKNTQELAYKYATANAKEVPQSWHEKKRAGAEWIYSFRKRNPTLSLRTPEATSLSRATSFNKHNVGLFFNNLRDIMSKYELLPNQIFNCDETGVTNVHRPPKILSSVKQKQVGKVTSAERGTLVTMCAAIGGNSSFIPPFFIFPRKIFKPFMLTGAPASSDGAANPSGWMTAENFVDYIKHFIKHIRCSRDNKVLLILDNHESHYDVRVLDICKTNGIILLTLPPHCSHKLQPLDVSCFFPFKAYYNKAVDDWMLNHPGVTMTIYDIAGAVGVAFPQAFTPLNITNGFKKTGVFPFNSQIFSDSDYMCSFVTNRPEAKLDVSISAACEDDIGGVKPSSPIPGTSRQEKPSSPTPGTSRLSSTPTEPLKCQIVTPQEIRPYLKASERKQTRRGRQKARSLVLTDTPVKTDLEQRFKERELKKRAKEERGLKKRVKEERKQNVAVKRKVFDESSSNSDVSVDEVCSQSTDVESDLEDFDDVSIVLDDFVIVKYAKKDYIKHYIGKVEAIEEEDFSVSFLKPLHLHSSKFAFPDKKDQDTIGMEDIVLKLPAPYMSGSTTRAARQFSFSVDLSKFNIM